MTTLQNITVADLLVTLGLTGYNNVVATVGTPNTKLVITVTDPAYAILADGTILTTELVTTAITGLTANDSYHLYLDYLPTRLGNDPVWTVATAAPTENALLLGDVTVATGHITAVSMATAGLNGSALAALNITKVA